jgi:general secretion pathway protein J
MRRIRGRGHSDGFTLVEILAAFAIAAVIIGAAAGLVRNVALHFDRGARGVADAERIVLAVDRLTADFGSARFIRQNTETGMKTAFTGLPEDGDQLASIAFVGAGVVAPGPPGDEMVALTIEHDGDVTRLVRRRARWLGPRSRLDDHAPQDPVVLIEGSFDIAFAFARAMPDGALAWSDSWTGDYGLPRLVRLTLNDRATGSAVLAGAEFLVRADAPAACAAASIATAVGAAATAKAASPASAPACLAVMPSGQPPAQAEPARNSP